MNSLDSNKLGTNPIHNRLTATFCTICTEPIVVTVVVLLGNVTVHVRLHSISNSYPYPNVNVSKYSQYILQPERSGFCVPVAYWWPDNNAALF